MNESNFTSVSQQLYFKTFQCHESAILTPIQLKKNRKRLQRSGEII